MRSPAFLRDILDAGAFVQLHSSGVSLEAYERHPLLRFAVDRPFEIIGEACKRLVVTDPEVAARLQGLPTVIAFRDGVARGYDHVDNERVPRIASTALPRRLSDVRAVLGKSVA